MHDSSPLHETAEKVDSLLRRFNARDIFRDRVREAAVEHADAKSMAEQRDRLRREAVAKKGVWGQ